MHALPFQLFVLNMVNAPDTTVDALPIPAGALDKRLIDSLAAAISSFFSQPSTEGTVTMVREQIVHAFDKTSQQMLVGCCPVCRLIGERIVTEEERACAPACLCVFMLSTQFTSR